MKQQQQRPSRLARSAQKPQSSLPKHWRVVVGRHAIAEAFSAYPRAIEMLWLRQGWESAADLRELAAPLKARGVKIEVKSPAELDKLTKAHQGAALFVSQTPTFNLEAISTKSKSTILLLDRIEDPHNLGAVLRTAWLMGADGILIAQDQAVGLTPTVHKVACGGVEHVPVEVCHSFAQSLDELKQNGFWVFGLSHEGKQDIFETKIPEKVVWAVGAEDKGLRSTTAKLCDDLIRIPQVSPGASYNASVAAAIVLAESVRQQRKK